jgi:hypothetical protein
LQEVLDDRCRPKLGRVGVLAGVAPGSPLGQKIPALVQLHSDLGETSFLLALQSLTHVSPLDPMFLFCQAAYFGNDVLIVH